MTGWAGWAFVALGDPKPQGNHRRMPNGHTIETTKGHGAWRDTVTAAGFGAGPCLDGPLLAAVAFTMRRPASARKRDHRPATSPDLSKLLRAAEDSVTAAGLWRDDGRVAEYALVAKTWPGEARSLPVPGVVFACVAEPWDRQELARMFREAREASWAKSGQPAPAVGPEAFELGLAL